MRNIKTTLRFVRNSALLFVAASGMAYLTACSETDINPDNGGNNDDNNLLVEQLKVLTGTNPSLAVTYDNSRQGTRASFDVPEHPGMAPVPSQADLDKMYKVTSETNFWDLGGKTPTEFYVTGTVSPSQLRCDNQAGSDTTKYYVDGTLSFGSFGGNQTHPCVVYLLAGSTLTCNGDIPENTTIYLYKGGNLAQASSEAKTIYHKGFLYAEGDLDHGDTDIKLQGSIYTTGKIHGKTVELNNSGEIYAGCAVTAVEKIYITNSARISAGYVSAPEIKLDSSPKVLLRDGGFMYAPTKLEVSNVESVRIEAEEGEYAMVQTQLLHLNHKSQWNNEKGEQDAINAFRNIGIKFTDFDGTQEPGDILFHESVNANGKGEITYYLIEDKNDACAPYKVSNNPAEDPGNTGDDPGNTGDDPGNTGDDPGNTGDDPGNTGDDPGNTGEDPGTSGEEPAIPGTDPEPTPGPKLENIGSVAPSDGDAHTHPISATCIFTNGNDAYLSWHTQGANFHGCIEYLTVNNGTVTLNSYLETAPSNDPYGAVDFNHVIFDNGKIFVAGDHPKKGGILGWIECNDGKFTTGEAVLNMRPLYNEKGGSGNCIIRNGNYYQVASVKGFETYNVADFVGAAKPKAVAQLAAYDFDPAAAEAEGRQTGKHIAIGGGKVAMLTLINRDKAANTATASIKVYDATDVKFENVIASYVVEDAVLSPVDGKDVIAINGDDIWVCLGKGGVQHLRLAGSTITKVSEFVLTKMSKEDLKGWEMSSKEAAASCANGLAVDSNYVYVAHGGAGLIVLNKEDLSLVTRTRYNGGKSANYVNLGADGYIYVAYGQSNVQVFAWRNN